MFYLSSVSEGTVTATRTAAIATRAAEARTASAVVVGTMVVVLVNSTVHAMIVVVVNCDVPAMAMVMVNVMVSVVVNVMHYCRTMVIAAGIMMTAVSALIAHIYPGA